MTQRQHEGHFCGCVMCTGGPLGARVSLKMVHFDGRAVGGAPDAISFKVHYEHLTTAKGSRDAFLGVTKSRVQSFSAVVNMGRRFGLMF